MPVNKVSTSSVLLETLVAMSAKKNKCLHKVVRSKMHKNNTCVLVYMCTGASY